MKSNNFLKRFGATILALAMILSLSIAAFAAPVAEATIDTTKTGSLTVYKYDLTNGATRS